MVVPMFNELRLNVIVQFVDIGEIVDHHCQNFLFPFGNFKRFLFQKDKQWLM
jgi:hypothetical protein